MTVSRPRRRHFELRIDGVLGGIDADRPDVAPQKFLALAGAVRTGQRRPCVLWCRRKYMSQDLTLSEMTLSATRSLRVRELTGRSSGRSVKRVVTDLGTLLRGRWNYFGVIPAGAARCVDSSSPTGAYLEAVEAGTHAHSRTHGTPNLQGVCGPDWGLTQGTVADEPGEVGCVCGAGTLFRIARSDHSLEFYRLISRTAEYGPVRSVVWEERREAPSLSRLANHPVIF
jgi:hypothetical protein